MSIEGLVGDGASHLASPSCSSQCPEGNLSIGRIIFMTGANFSLGIPVCAFLVFTLCILVYIFKLLNT